MSKKIFMIAHTSPFILILHHCHRFVIKKSYLRLPFTSSITPYFPSSLASWLNLFFIIFHHLHHNHHLSPCHRPMYKREESWLPCSMFNLHPLPTSSSKQRTVIDFPAESSLSEPVFVILYGAQESIPTNRFRQPMWLGGPVRKIEFSHWPARLWIDSWAPQMVYKYGLSIYNEGTGWVLLGSSSVCTILISTILHHAEPIFHFTFLV